MKTIVLKEPIRISETLPEIRELCFREKIVAGDLRGIKMSSLQDPDMGDLLKIAGRLCGQSDMVMNRLELKDIPTVIGLVSDFLSDGQETGTEPSLS